MEQLLRHFGATDSATLSSTQLAWPVKKCQIFADGISGFLFLYNNRGLSLRQNKQFADATLSGWRLSLFF